MIGRGSESKRTVATTASWACRAAVSVSPTEAYSGSVKLPIGLTWAGSAVFRPRTALVAATSPWRTASCTTIARPVTSPAAKTCGALVRSWVSTSTYPRRFVCTPARYDFGDLAHQDAGSNFHEVDA